MWFAFSLFSVLAWAGSDFFSKKGTRAEDKLSHWRIIIVVGFVMGICAALEILGKGINYAPINIIRYLPVSFMYILSMALGYAGLRYIELSVSSPICNSSGAVAALLMFLFLKQSMEFVQFAAVAGISAGIFLLAVFQKQKDDALRKLSDGKAEKRYTVSFLAIFLPVLYCIIDGLGTFMDNVWLESHSFWVIPGAETMSTEALGEMIESVANISYEFTFLIMALFGLFYLYVFKKDSFSLKKAKLFGIGALCETAGQFTYIRAISENGIVAAPLISSYSIFSVLLSRIFLKEKLSVKQYAVIAAVIIGIIVLGIYDV